MAQFVGTWDVEAEENLDEMFGVFGVDDSMRQKAKEGKINPSQQFAIDGEEYRLKTTIGHISAEITFKLGVTFPGSSMDGQPIKITFSKEGDKLIERQEYKTHNATITREVHDNTMVATVTGQNKTAVIKYRRRD